MSPQAASAPKTVEAAKPAAEKVVEKAAEKPAEKPAEAPAQAKPTGSPGLNFMPGYGSDVEGVLVENVRPGGAADKAGLAAGDVIVKFAGIKVANVEEYMAALGSVQPGDKVEIVFKRGDETKTVKAEVGVSSR